MTRAALTGALPYLYARQSADPCAVGRIGAWVRRVVIPAAWDLMDRLGSGAPMSMPLPYRMAPCPSRPAMDFTPLWIVRLDHPTGRESFYLTVAPVPEPAR